MPPCAPNKCPLRADPALAPVVPPVANPFDFDDEDDVVLR